MTHYEELGIRPDASTDEVRQAYRTVARLLHPDQQQDAGLKLAAERQMRRLNEVLCILTDPPARRAYDSELATPRHKAMAVLAVPSFARCVPWYRGALAGVLFWGLIGIGSAGLVLWSVITSPVNPSLGPSEESAKPLPRVPKMEGAARNQAAVPAGEAHADSHPTSPRPGKAEPQPVLEIPTADPVVTSVPVETQHRVPNLLAIEPASKEVLREPPVPSQSIAQQDEGYKGLWLFVPGSSPGPKPRYEPVFAEMTVREERSTLHGSYRARYRVPDQPISSEVSFQFVGDERDGKIHWQSADGASGKGVLIFLQEDLLEADWWSTVSGSRTKLTSGSAVLIRQHNR
jgi:hypothetical protein